MVKEKPGMEESTAILTKAAILSRTVIVILQVFFNAIPDHAADAFKPADTDVSKGVLDNLVRSGLDGYSKWDAKYFLHIARNGYEEERMFAFFPLFPMLLRYSARAVEVLLPLSFQSCLLLCGAILNTLFFIGATNSLYKLTYTIYRQQSFALLVAALFCFNPASIFFSSNYTESLYSYLVFGGLNCLENGKRFCSALWFLAGSTTRSNGLVNAGFILYWTLKNWISIPFHYRKELILKDVLPCVLACVAAVSPFLLFNVYGHLKFCPDGAALEWCDQHMLSLYQYVQAKYWDVGFLNYFKPRKLPNFLLAMPCQLLVTYGSLCYLKVRSDQIWSLGLLDRYPGRKVQSTYTHLRFYLVSRNVFVYVAHAAFLLLFSFLFMHVEVTTRFTMSSSPLPYWIAASLVFRDVVKVFPRNATVRDIVRTFQPTRLSLASKAVLLYFITYVVIGTLLHVNYLPWT